jgi:alpha-beta hydrolase superfamily lysophospholipase
VTALEVIDKGGESRFPPLLFVHGAWHAAWCWDEHFLDWFAGRGYRAVALSLRGHGGSPAGMPVDALSIADYVADVRTVADGLPRRPVVVGHSMGGFVVQKYLQSHDAPGGVLMASVSHTGMTRETLRLARLHPWRSLKATLTGNSRVLVETPDLVREIHFAATMPRARVLRHFERFQDESRRALREMHYHDLPRPERVTAPMLVLGAGDDALLRPERIRATARAYGTTAELFPGMAHDMMLEDGWAEVAERIHRWLDARVNH